MRKRCKHLTPWLWCSSLRSLPCSLPLTTASSTDTMTRTVWNTEQKKRFETALRTWQCGLPGAPVAAEELQRRQTLVDDLNKVPGGKTATMENVVKKAQKMRALAATTPQMTDARSTAASSGDASGIPAANHLEMHPANNSAMDLMDGSFRGGAASDPNDTLTLSSRVNVPPNPPAPNVV